MICPSCGAEISDSARFCEQCGTRVPDADEAPADDGGARGDSPHQPSAPAASQDARPEAASDAGESQAFFVVSRVAIFVGAVLALLWLLPVMRGCAGR